MTRDEIISLVQGRMNRTDNTTLAQTEIKMAQIELERGPFLPWFLVDTSDALSTAANVETVTLPAGFLRELDEEETCVWVVKQSSTPYQYKPLVKHHTYSALLAKYRYNENQEPAGYFLGSTSGGLTSELRLRPIPEDIYPLRVRSYIADTVLSSNVENAWTKWAPDLVAARLGMLLTRYDVDKTVYDMFATDYNQAMARLQVQDEARRQAALDAVMGDEDA